MSLVSYSPEHIVIEKSFRHVEDMDIYIQIPHSFIEVTQLRDFRDQFGHRFIYWDNQLTDQIIIPCADAVHNLRYIVKFHEPIGKPTFADTREYLDYVGSVHLGITGIIILFSQCMQKLAGLGRYLVSFDESHLNGNDYWVYSLECHRNLNFALKILKEYKLGKYNSESNFGSDALVLSFHDTPVLSD